MHSRCVYGGQSVSRVVTRQVSRVFWSILILCLPVFVNQKHESLTLYVIQDYLYQLAESMRALAPASYDAHLFTLEVSRVVLSSRFPVPVPPRRSFTPHDLDERVWPLTSSIWPRHRTRYDSSTRDAVGRTCCAIDVRPGTLARVA